MKYRVSIQCIYYKDYDIESDSRDMAITRAEQQAAIEHPFADEIKSMGVSGKDYISTRLRRTIPQRV